MVSNEELYDALKTIRKLCGERADCGGCPLSLQDSCRCAIQLSDVVPAEWVIEPPPPPRAYTPIKNE